MVFGGGVSTTLSIFPIGVGGGGGDELEKLEKKWRSDPNRCNFQSENRHFNRLSSK